MTPMSRLAQEGAARWQAVGPPARLVYPGAPGGTPIPRHSSYALTATCTTNLAETPATRSYSKSAVEVARGATARRKLAQAKGERAVKLEEDHSVLEGWTTAWPASVVMARGPRSRHAP
jgi:hypothetical protein